MNPMTARLWFPLTGVVLLLLAAQRPHRAAGMELVPAVGGELRLRVGTAAVEITPPVGWRMAGGFDERISTGIHDPLFVKAMVLAQGDVAVALVICDVCSVGRELTDPARERAARETGIPRGHIAICATHTHAGPEYYGTLRDLFHERAVRADGRDRHESVDYRQTFIEACVRAIAEAHKGLRPMAASAGVARLPGFAHNRRYLMKDGTVEFNPPRNSPAIVRAAGPVDDDFPILLFRDAEAGQPRAALSVFAMHVATFGGTTFGADYAGRLQELLGKDFGGGFFSLFGQGTAGDINHLRFLSDQADPTTDEIGAALARTFLAEVPRLRPADQPALAALSAVVELPLQEVTDEAVERAKAVLNRTWVPEPAFLVQVDAWKVLNTRRLRERDGDSLKDEVLAVRVDDDTAIVILPHEVFVELGMAIKRGSPFQRTFIISMANDLDFYVPTKRAFAEGSYEIVTSSVKPGGGERLVEGALRLLRQLKGPAATADAPQAPPEARNSFRIEKGLRIELVAAEPMVVSPVACAFDAHGRLYVAENRAYPTGPGEGKPPAGRIALLEDVDGDGRMDRRFEFAQGLTFPNGVMPWKGGVIVTCAPDVLWLRDSDGDGKADERKVLFTGFSTQGSTQLRVSHPTLSVDNWIYLTSGLTGGSVTAPEHPEHAAVSLGRTDFRFRPDGREFEAADGGSQFGLTFDDFGRRFICYNRVQVQHVVIASAVLRRNPHLALSETVQDCPAEMAPEPLKGHGSAARLYPISRNVTTADSHAGTFTAACAVTVFRGGGLPDAFRGGVFSCDPTGNLVHFDRLEPSGASFTAVPAHAGVEFLASTDNWFRPVFLSHGPDGALYVCDMYRKTIEHPDYLPAEVRKRTDFEGGKGMGRIWRVIRNDARAEDLAGLRRVNLAAGTAAELCAAILDRDGWHRDTAHRLLLERRDPGARGPLTAIATDPASPPTSVVHALRLLEALDGLTDNLVRGGLDHPAPGVRENALQLAEIRSRDNSLWLRDILRLAADPDPRVRFQAAIALGSARTPAGADPVPAALARIAARDGHDRWLRAAVFSSLSNRETRFLETLRDLAAGGATPAPELLTELGRMLARSAPRQEWPTLIRLVVAPDEQKAFPLADQAALLTGLAESARGKLSTAEKGDVLAALAADDAGLAASVRSVVDAMAAAALDPTAAFERRREAAGLLGFAGFDRAGQTLLKLVDPAQPPALQVAAVRALGTERDPQVAAALLSSERFNAYTPAIRDEVLSALLAQSSQVAGVLDAVADGRVPAGAVDALRRRQLTQHADSAIRRRAEALFGVVSGNRAKIYDAYKDVVSLKPDPAHGRAVFKRECSQCHRLDQEGSALGPDLFGIRNQPKEAILLHLLVPDHEITPGFAAYRVATRDGRVLTGLIASETPSSITLRQPLGKEDTIPRDEVEELAASKQSLMPEGLENSISRQELADLLAYLKGEAGGSK